MSSLLCLLPASTSPRAADVPLVRRWCLSLAFLLWQVSCALGQPTVISDDRLPPDSIEMKRDDPPATAKPWQLPKPNDPLYNAAKEAQIKKENAAGNPGHAHLVRTYERGVFAGYSTLSVGQPGEKPAHKMDSIFVRNPKLPPDAVELSGDEQPDTADYYQTLPKNRPGNVPDDCLPVRVFHRGKLVGWTYLSKDDIARLHQAR